MRWPVSIKGVVIRDNRVVLLKNERDEWELPGGKLDPDEAPEKCVVREIAEELSLDVEVVRILDSWVYEVFSDVKVLIVTYFCREKQQAQAKLSNEHSDVCWCAFDQIESLNMPTGYKHSILRAIKESA